MKTPVPVTLDDLEATAKDDRHGISLYQYVKVYHDDATNSFSYWYKGQPISKLTAEEYLKSLENKAK